MNFVIFWSKFECTNLAKNFNTAGIIDYVVFISLIESNKEH